MLAAFPAESARFLSGRQDPFANPVGHAVRSGAETLFDALIGGASSDAADRVLADLAAILAVQEFAPSVGVAFPFALKRIVRELADASGDGKARGAALREFEAAADALALKAFDRYVEARERLMQVRINEIKRLARFYAPEDGAAARPRRAPGARDGSCGPAAAEAPEVRTHIGGNGS